MFPAAMEGPHWRRPLQTEDEVGNLKHVDVLFIFSGRLSMWYMLMRRRQTCMYWAPTHICCAGGAAGANVGPCSVGLSTQV